MTTCDVVERALKKGKGGEIEAGARLGMLLAMQLSDPENIYKELKPQLVQMVTDKTVSPGSRAAVANTLAGLCFVGGGEMAEVVGVMATLETVFSAAYNKSDHPPEVAALHAACLSGWSLLLSLQSPGEVHRIANTFANKFENILHSNDVDLRITAGEAIALLLEFAYDFDEVSH